jgi:hypothetical protein
MQGKKENILSSVNKIEDFQGKLKLWLELTASGSTEIFPTVCSFGADKFLFSVVEAHINTLQKKIKEHIWK